MTRPCGTYMVAAVSRLLPAPVSRFPFNASLHELRLQMIRNRLGHLAGP